MTFVRLAGECAGGAVRPSGVVDGGAEIPNDTSQAVDTLERVSVRQIGLDERELVRRVRLRALRDAPDAFASTYEREVAFPPSAWDRRLAARANAHFVLELAEVGLAGLVSVVRDDTDPTVAYLVGMWVDGTGAADALVAEALGWAERQRITTLRLHVTDGNVSAERLYLRHGFARTAQSSDRARDGATEFEMQLSLGAP
jgi:GNAT superfamily N-acetyltransferase